MQKTQTIKNRLKIVIISIAIVFLGLTILLITQTVRLHNLSKQQLSSSTELSELQSSNAALDKEIEESSKLGYEENLKEQEDNYGSEDDYLFD